MFNPLSGRFPSLIHPSYFYPNPPLVCLKVFLKILVPSKSYWKWWKGLLAVKSLFKCHLFINAANKIVAGHSMRRGEVYLPRKLPPTIFAPPIWSFLFFSGFHETLTILSPLSSLGRRSPQSWYTSSSGIMQDIPYSNPLQSLNLSKLVTQFIVVSKITKKKWAF